MKRQIKRFGNILERLLSQRQLKEIEDTKALERLAPYLEGYYPWTGSTLRPSAICMIFNEIIIHRHSRVLELGCGISTILLSKFLMERGGSMVSVDDNIDWINVVREGMNSDVEACTIIHSELITQRVDGADYEWYDMKNIIENKNFAGEKFDVLVVDAPISSVSHKARYPAFPMLKEYLADDFVVILDDIDRDNEMAIAKEWCDSYDLIFNISNIVGGVGIFRPASTKNKFNIM